MRVANTFANVLSVKVNPAQRRGEGQLQEAAGGRGDDKKSLPEAVAAGSGGDARPYFWAVRWNITDSIQEKVRFNDLEDPPSSHCFTQTSSLPTGKVEAEEH